jgi:hypothetical protein
MLHSVARGRLTQQRRTPRGGEVSNTVTNDDAWLLFRRLLPWVVSCQILGEIDYFMHGGESEGE